VEIGERQQRNKNVSYSCFPATETTQAAREAPYTKATLSGEEVRTFSGALLEAVLLTKRKTETCNCTLPLKLGLTAFL